MQFTGDSDCCREEKILHIMLLYMNKVRIRSTNCQEKKRVGFVMQERKEMWVTSLGWGEPLEEGMVAHSTILAWRRKEKPGRL